MIATSTDTKRAATLGAGRRKTEDMKDRLRRLPLTAASTPWQGTDKQTPVVTRERQDTLPAECYYG